MRGRHLGEHPPARHTLDHLNRCLVLKQLAETVVEHVFFSAFLGDLIRAPSLLPATAILLAIDDWHNDSEARCVRLDPEARHSEGAAEYIGEFGFVLPKADLG